MGKVEQMISNFGDENPFKTDGADFTTADGHSGLITRTRDEERIPKGWFINLVEFSRRGVPRWCEWSEGTRRNVRNTAFVYAGNRSIYISDEPLEIDSNDCQDFGLNDTNGDSCDAYTTGQWCTHHALPTAAGCAHWGFT